MHTQSAWKTEIEIVVNELNETERKPHITRIVCLCAYECVCECECQCMGECENAKLMKYKCLKRNAI